MTSKPLVSSQPSRQAYEGLLALHSRHDTDVLCVVPGERFVAIYPRFVYLLWDITVSFRCTRGDDFVIFQSYCVKLSAYYPFQIGGLQPISRDTDNNAAMYNCWWTNKRS